MTEPFDEYGDRLRRVLHAEADAVVPSPEGLEKIQTKIEQSRERRLWYLRPWLRPLAAMSAAIALTIIAVPASSAFKNFVQTGHFSSQSGQGGSGRTPDGRRLHDQPPAGPRQPGSRFSARPSASPTTSPGAHAVPGACPSVADEVTPSATTSPSLSALPPIPEPSGSAPQVTCRPGTSSPSPSLPVSGVPTDSSSAQPPASEPPTGGAQPSPQSSP